MTNATDPYHALMNITARPQTVFVKGEGAYLWDKEGHKYLDLLTGWGVRSSTKYGNETVERSALSRAT